MDDVFLRRSIRASEREKQEPQCDFRWLSKQGFNKDCQHRCRLFSRGHKQQHTCACGSTRKKEKA